MSSVVAELGFVERFAPHLTPSLSGSGSIAKVATGKAPCALTLIRQLWCHAGIEVPWKKGHLPEALGGQASGAVLVNLRCICEMKASQTG